MKPHDAINQQLINPSSSLPAQVASVCNVCRTLEDCGEYEDAWELLAESYHLTADGADLSGFDDASKAEIMLRQGVLTGWLGGRSQTDGSQERAKDLISGSVELFRSLGNRSREAEGYIALAACYHRQSLLDNGRACVQTALGLIAQIEEEELRVRALIRLAYIERDAGRLHEALRIHREAKPVVEACANDALKGMYHNEYALVSRRLAAAEDKPELYDGALIEYTAASIHYERAGNLRYQSAVENNQGYLLMKLRRFSGAHAHVDRALDIAARLKDKEFTGQFLDTRAQIFIGQGRCREAVQAARKSVELLKGGEQKALLVASLITYGIALSRDGENFRALTSLEKAVSLAEDFDDHAGLVLASVAMINEIDSLSPRRQASIYMRALDKASRLQDGELYSELAECAGRILNSRASSEAAETEADPLLPANWEGFSYTQWVAHVEQLVLSKALIDADGSVRKASKLLGLKNHQALFAKLKRHSGLKELQSTTRPESAAAARQKNQPPQAGELKRIRIGQNSLSGMGIYAGSVVVAFMADVRPGDLVAVTTSEGNNAVGLYKLAGKKIVLEVSSMEYEAFEFERGEVVEIRKVYAWYPEEDELDVHVV